MHLSTELSAITNDKLVTVEVVRGYGLGHAGHTSPGDVVHIPAGLASQYAQEGSVRVRRTKAGAIATVPNPDYVLPPPIKTARIRIRIPSHHHPIGEPGIRHCEVGEIIEVEEAVAVYACSGGNPAAVRVP